MSYTQEQIKEMRKRLPFKAVVWEHKENKQETIIVHILDDGTSVNNHTFWSHFEEIKEPCYVPFTFDDAKLFRDEWIEIFSKSISKIVNVHINGVTVVDDGDELTFMTYDHLFENVKFADSGKPFGKEVK